MSEAAIDFYDVYDRRRREARNSDYTSAAEFSDLASRARARGYRKATIGEIHASAESLPHASELFCWCGGLWVRIDAATAQPHTGEK